MISEERLREAAQEAEAALLGSLPPPDQCVHEFSPEFERRMEPLLRRHRRSAAVRRVLTRAAVILLALLLTGGLWLGTDAQARRAVTGWLWETYETVFVYRFAGPAQNNAMTAEYRPTWLPEGWVEVDVLQTGNHTHVVYRDSAGQLNYFSYSSVANSSNLYVIPDECLLQHVQVGTVTADLYLSKSDKVSSNIVWSDSDSGTLFSISAFTDQNSLIDMAESVIVK